MRAQKTLRPRLQRRKRLKSRCKPCWSKEESLVAAECKAQDAVAQAKTASESFAGADVALSEAGAALERAMRAEQDAYQAVQRRGELQQATQAAAEPYQRALERLKAAEIVHDKDLAQVQQLQKAQRAGRAGPACGGFAGRLALSGVRFGAFIGAGAGGGQHPER